MDLIFSGAFTFLIFTVLLIATWKRPSFSKNRTRQEWWIDSLCLFQQGVLIPWLGTWGLSRLWAWLFPLSQGVLKWSPIFSIVVCFVLIDYAYYWNHRLLHSARLWKWHGLHHSAREMDFYLTSRNSALTPFLLVYLWTYSIFSYLLGEAKWFLLAASIGAGLDLWRHSGFDLRPGTWLYRLVSPWLTLPQDHSWHHANGQAGVNFGANLIIWDRWYGTFWRPFEKPSSWGDPEFEPSWRTYLLPGSRP